MNTKFIYVIYLILLSIGGFLVLQLVFATLLRRPMPWRGLIGFTLLIGVLAGGYFWERARGLSQSANMREAYAIEVQGPARIAVPWTVAGSSFVLGAQRALDEINRAPITVVKPDGSRAPVTFELKPYIYNPGTGVETARKIASDPSIVGVIGHPDSDDAIKASATYDASRLLYFAPTIHLAQLTQHGFPTVFRLSPSDMQIAQAIAAFADQADLFNILIASPRDQYGYDLFQIYAAAISARRSSAQQVDAPNLWKFVSYAPGQKRFDEIVTNIAETAAQRRIKVDLVVVLGSSSTEARMVEQMRKRGLATAVIVLPGLRDEVLELARQTPESTAGPIYVLSYADEPQIQRGTEVTERGSLENMGYDAVQLMTQAFARTGSLVGREAAVSLRAMPNWSLGKLSIDFTPTGAISAMPIRVLKIDAAAALNLMLVYEHKPETVMQAAPPSN